MILAMKVIATILSLLLEAILIWFNSTVRDRVSKIGFGFMIVVILIDIIMMWV